MISGGKLGDMYGVILVYQTHSGFSDHLGAVQSIRKVRHVVIRPREKPAPAGHYPLVMTNIAMVKITMFNR